MTILRAMLLLIFPQMRRKLSTAKTIVVKGEAIAYTRIYCIAKSASASSAPMNCISHGAAKKNIAPEITPVMIIIKHEQVK